MTYVADGERTSPRFCAAFAEGCGGKLAHGPRVLHPGPVALWGSPALWPLLERAQAQGRDWIYADNAYVGRGRYFRIAVNGYQHDGTGAGDFGRFIRAGGTLQPWRRSGARILVCPNSHVHFPLFGRDADQWVADVVAELREHTDRRIQVRWKKEALERPIDVDLVDAWAVVAWSSAAAIDALMAGVPAFSLAPHAAARRMGSTELADIETPLYPDDREGFFAALAANQWTLDEIRAGVAWRALQEEYA